MKRTAENCKNFINNNIPRKHQKLFYQFFDFMQLQQTKRNVPRSYNTIYIDLTTVNTYLQTINYDFSLISPTTVREYIDPRTGKTGLFAKIKYFLILLLEQKLITEELYKNIGKLYFKNIVIVYKEKKFAIPQKKWESLYNQLVGVKKFALWFLFHTGVRVGELISLEITDIHIDHVKQEYYVSIHPKKEINFYPKTEQSIRNIPLRKQEIEVIEQYLSMRNQQKLDHNWLIYNVKKNNQSKDKGRIKTEMSIKYWFDRIFYYDDIPDPNFACTFKLYCHKRLNRKKEDKNRRVACNELFPTIPSHRHITPHLTRYSFASNIYYKGLDKGVDLLNEVSKLLGHSNAQITFQYLQLDRKDQTKRSLNALEIAYEDN